MVVREQDHTLESPAADMETVLGALTNRADILAAVERARDAEEAETAENAETIAQQLLSDAFSFGASGVTPVVQTSAGGLVHLTHSVSNDPMDRYTVDLTEDSLFPVTLYHFCHSNEKAQIDLATDDSVSFDDRFLMEAKAFVKTVYGVDCADAEAHAYCYQNKVCVELLAAKDQIFHVRFCYNDSVPTSALYFSDSETARASMDINHARQLF